MYTPTLWTSEYPMKKKSLAQLLAEATVTHNQLEQEHLNFPSLENAICSFWAQDLSLTPVWLCVRNWRRNALLRSSNSAFCQQKTSHGPFSEILLSLLLSTLPDGFQIISFKRLMQLISSLFAPGQWPRQARACLFVSSSQWWVFHPSV